MGFFSGSNSYSIGMTAKRCVLLTSVKRRGASVEPLGILSCRFNHFHHTLWEHIQRRIAMKRSHFVPALVILRIVPDLHRAYQPLTSCSVNGGS